MSDLKHMTPEELTAEIQSIGAYISKLKSKIAGQSERLKWAEKYLFEKTPQELSITEIERKLGHKVIIRREG